MEELHKQSGRECLQHKDWSIGTHYQPSETCMVGVQGVKRPSCTVLTTKRC